MQGQYSFSNSEPPPEARPAYTALAVDTGSPLASVAVAVRGEVVAQRAVEQRRSSGKLLGMIDEVLAEAGLPLAEVKLLLGLRGPGSFTGLRIGLATLQGIRLALGTPAATFSTLQVLATLAPAHSGLVTACVDALRGQWLAQVFESSAPFRPVSEPRLCSAADLFAAATHQFVGFEISRLRNETESRQDLQWIEPGPLASQALRALDFCAPDPDPARLSDPLYLRPPATTVPGPPPGHLSSRE